MMELQEFIEKNSGKNFMNTRGEEFVFEKIILTARHRGEGAIVVSLVFPWFAFSDCFDIKELNLEDGDLVGFYYWLKDKFIPMAEDKQIKLCLNHSKEN